MTTHNDPHSIVNLDQQRAAVNTPSGELLAAVASITITQLKILTDAMFDHVDDSLFDLAEKAESNAVQTQYFDGMREVRKQRPRAVGHFLEHVRRGLKDFASVGNHHDSKPNPSTAGPELALVDDAELEESLAVSSMISKTQTRLARQLYATHQRLSVICGGTHMDNATGPIAPAALCQAFRVTMREFNLETRVRLIIYKLFDRYVMSGLEVLYVQVNAKLVQAGVMPVVRHATSGHHGTAPAARPGKASNTVATGAHEVGVGAATDESDADFQAEFYRALNELLVARRRQLPVNAAAAAMDLPSLSPAELLGALNLLQGEAATALPPADVASLPADPLLAASDLAQLKQQLLHQVSQLRGSSRARMSGADEDTIDLVGMLFEFILKDRNLPAQMQVLLARLQIPYLKAAILDRRLFAHASHPARRLLDALAEAAKGWSRESDRDGRLYAKVRAIVDTVLQDFDDDLDIFSRLEEDLAAFLAAERTRAQRSEQRLTEAAEGREKLQRARRRVAQEVLDRIDQRKLPPLVHGVLTRAWANYMVLTLLRQGGESAEFRAALRFVNDFIWSVLPMQSDADRQRLRQLLPSLEKALRHGLATVAFQEHDVENLIGQLNRVYCEQLGEPLPAAPTAGEDEHPAIPEALEDLVQAESVTPKPEEDPAASAAPAAPAAASDDPNMARVRALNVGNWLEFKGAEGSAPERVKLSWISPISGKYLFVNRRGLKVADKTATQLAREFAAGTVLVLEELPLFDRALDAIVERLRQAPAHGQDARATSTPPLAPGAK